MLFLEASIDFRLPYWSWNSFSVFDLPQSYGLPCLYGAIDQTAPGQQRLPKVEKQTSTLSLSRNLRKYKDIYYINTNEIPGELSRENLISSHVKISPLLWLHNESRLSHQKNYLKSEMVWYFISVYIINRTLHGRLEIRNSSSRVEKIFHSFAALTDKIFFNTRREISYLQAAM